MTVIEYPQELEPVLAQAVAVARLYYIDNKRMAALQTLDKAIELYKYNKTEKV